MHEQSIIQRNQEIRGALPQQLSAEEVNMAKIIGTLLAERWNSAHSASDSDSAQMKMPKYSDKPVV